MTSVYPPDPLLVAQRLITDSIHPIYVIHRRPRTRSRILHRCHNARHVGPATTRLLAECANVKASIYFLFIGIGGSSFRYLEQIGDRFPNVGFLNVKDLASAVGDEAIYESLLPEELCVWLKATKRGGATAALVNT